MKHSRERAAAAWFALVGFTLLLLGSIVRSLALTCLGVALFVTAIGLSADADRRGR